MKSTTDMQTGTSQTEQRQMPFQMNISPIFSAVISKHGEKTDP